MQRRAFIWLAIALGVGILLWLLSPVLTPFLLGAILAYILQPGVAWMVRRRVPRTLAALLMMLLFLVSITASRHVELNYTNISTAKMGYKQELRRNFSALEVFGTTNFQYHLFDIPLTEDF